MSLESQIKELNSNLKTLIDLMSKQPQLDLSLDEPNEEASEPIEKSESITEDMVRKLSEQKISEGVKRTEIKEVIAQGGAKTIAKLDNRGLNVVYNLLKDMVA